MEQIQILFILLFAAVLLIGLAQKFYLPYPIALVLGGAALGFIPGLYAIDFEPDLILFLVLPPILYYASFRLAYFEFKKNWWDIFSLAIGLVAFTTVIIAFVFKEMFPQYPWALAFAFGAIVSPPDAVSATAIFKRFKISPSLVSKLEGESLINDASALILYKMAVVALLSGTFSFKIGGSDFIYGVVGGIALGAALGFILQYFSKQYLEPVLGVVFSFTIPYLTYVIASYLQVSGVLAVVVNGLIGSSFLHTHHSSLRRVLGYAVWDILAILLNAFVFILIGLQLQSILAAIPLHKLFIYMGYAVLIFLIMVLIRMVWIYSHAAGYYIHAYYRSKTKLCTKILKEAAVIGWSGMRGIVSLAAAFALPYTLYNGEALPGRAEVIFMTFIVILLTLVVPGLSLPALLRRLDIQYVMEKDKVQQIRNQLAKIAQNTLEDLHQSKYINESEHVYLKNYFITHSYVMEKSRQAEIQAENSESARHHVIQSLRENLLKMWKTGEIDDDLFKLFENELDIIDVHIARGELK